MTFTLTYDDIINTVSAMIENDKINKVGLTLHYAISEFNHKKLDEDLYYRANPKGADFQHRETIEITLGGIEIIVTKAIE